MELNNFELSDSKDISVTSRRDETGSRYLEEDNIYDSSQDILDACNRDLEELSMKVLKSSVRCHMLEVDLATQFNPQTQQMLADAQEACQLCTETIHDICEQVFTEITSHKVPSPTATLPEHQSDTTVASDTLASFASESMNSGEKPSDADKVAVTEFQEANSVISFMENGSQ